MKQAQPEPARLLQMDTQAPHGLELRHLRYLVAVADAGTFTRAAEQMFIAQPTLSQQIRQLEQLLGTPLLHRRRDGVQLTAAGAVLLDAARDVLSRVDHGVSQTRQAAGLDRPRLRIALPADLPDSLAVQTASRLRSAADSERSRRCPTRCGRSGSTGWCASPGCCPTSGSCGTSTRWTTCPRGCGSPRTRGAFVPWLYD
jgi:molybdenum-dependent DNA-binding transcriptional regulator ModE